MIPGVLNEPGTISMNGVGSNDISVHLNESGTINNTIHKTTHPMVPGSFYTR